MAKNGLTQRFSDGYERRTRRQLLAGGAGALGLAAAWLTRAAPAQAANGDGVILGQLNQSTTNTAINDSGGDTCFSALGTSTGTALEGDAVDGTGVVGTSQTGIGVSGSTGSTAFGASAVFGEILSTSPASFSAGVRGQNDGLGGSGVGVYGSHAGSGWGVYGTSISGIGVNGNGGTGIGVEGSGGTGVFGVGTTGVAGRTTAPHGVGVQAQNTAGGVALKVQGQAEFSRSGVATVAAHRSSVTHNLPLTSASFVLATIQGNVSGLYVKGVTITTGSHSSFTIHLSKSVSSKTKVAWLVVN